MKSHIVAAAVAASLAGPLSADWNLERWLGVSGGSISNLQASPEYPNNPGFQTRVVGPLTTGSSRWGDSYGSRARAYLTVPETGQYFFTISGDDNTQFFLSTDEDPANAIKQLEIRGWTSFDQWDKYADQSTDPIDLVAGQRYYLEILHKEGGGGDHFSLGWSRDGGSPVYVPDSALTAFDSTVPVAAGVVVNAGQDRELYMPRVSLDLQGQLLDVTQGTRVMSGEWEQLSGPAVTLSDATAASPEVLLTEPGEYTFRLTGTNGAETLTDEVKITLHPPLHPQAGQVEQGLWLRLGHNGLGDLTGQLDFPQRPDLRRTLENTVSGLTNFADRYGARTAGQLYVPEDGRYRFMVSGDDFVSLSLSPDASVENLSEIAKVESTTGRYDFLRFEGQISDWIELRRGQPVALELLHLDRWGGEHHDVYWQREGQDAAEPLGVEFLAPEATAYLSGESVDYDSRLWISAGPDLTLYWPSASTELAGYAQRRWGSGIDSRSWEVVSGGDATFSETDSSTPEVTFSAPGTYVLRYSVVSGEETFSDECTITVAEALSPQVGRVRRDVWFGYYETMDGVRADERFPNEPDITDALPDFDAPRNWANRYASRLSGLLRVPVSGEYRFYAEGDDEVELWFSMTGDRADAQMIAQEGSARAGDGVSELVALEAGQTYYVELLHRERWGNDRAVLKWTLGDGAEPQLVRGAFVEAIGQPYDYDESLVFYGDAGGDRQYWWPHGEATLEGQIHKVGSSEDEPTTEWSQIAGPPASIANTADLASAVTFSQPGTYEFRLTLRAGEKTHISDVTYTIHEALADDTGFLTRSVWMDFYEQSIERLLEHDPGMDQPTFRDLLPGAVTPREFTEFYGTQLRGYLQVPVTGEYRFYVAGDDAVRLWLTTPNEGRRVIADLTRWTYPLDFDRYDSQKSEPIFLNAGERYEIEALQFEHRGGDHLAIAMQGPATNHVEPLSRGFISPYTSAGAHDPDIEIVLGPDRRILWPDSTIGQAALVYDLDDGPDRLTLEWTASDDRVQISAPNAAFSQFTFPEPGLYELKMTASDGANTAAEVIAVSVNDPLSTGSGGITRELWTDTPWMNLSDYRERGLPDTPANVVDRLEGFDTPFSFGDNYVQRLTGVLRVPREMTGRFYVAANDYAIVSVNPSGVDPAGAQTIITARHGTGRYRFNRYDWQRSEETFTLRPGEEYFVEIWHKEHSNEDYCTLAFGDHESDEGVSQIPNAWVSPTADAPNADLAEDLVVDAGESVLRHWPVGEITLKGSAYDAAPGPYPLTHRWSMKRARSRDAAAGDGVIIHSPDALETQVEFTAPGKYTFELVATDGDSFVRDTVVVSIQSPLADDAGSILVERFDDVSGWNISDLKRSDSYPDRPASRYRLTSLDKPKDEGDKYGLRMRGYILPPASGIYRFNITSDDWGEVFLSTDDTAENAALLCLSPFAAGYYEWDRDPEYQLSRPVKLKRGQRYYIEVRYKESGWRDHLSVAWLCPRHEEYQIIDGAYLAPFEIGDDAPPTIDVVGDREIELGVGAEFSDPGVTATDASGNDITDRVEVRGSVDTSQAGRYQLRYVVTDDSGRESVIARRDVTVSIADRGAASFPADASAHVSPPADYSALNGSISPLDASRFLMQASFGPTEEAIAEVQRLGYERWIDRQFALPASSHLAILDHYGSFMGAKSGLVARSRDGAMGSGLEMMPMDMPMGRLDQDDRMHSWWTTAIDGPDQLRQRVAFALSEILVLSDYNPLLERYPRGVTHYYDILVNGAFGNYRDLVEEVTLNPMMGFYLTMLRSDKEVPDENYAREVMQLFTIGLEQLNLDGTKKLDANGNRQSTYVQSDVSELAKAFTGWTFAGSREFLRTWETLDTISPMMPFEEHHHRGEKRIIGGAVIPAGQTAREDLEQALDVLHAHPNVGPFLARRLIQRMVTSNPSPAYIYRVSSAFEDNGLGERGDLKAVVKAVLLDPEARERSLSDPVRGGKLREPIVRMTHLLRALQRDPSSDPPVLGRYTINNPYFTIRQAPLWAVSVFNFFEPNFQVPGPLMDAGLFSPEFQIANEVSVVDTSNLFFNGVRYGFSAEHEMSRRQGIDISSVSTAPDDLEATLDRIELLLLGREMRAETRAALRDYAVAHFDSNRPERTTQAILQLLLSSPDFCVER